MALTNSERVGKGLSLLRDGIRAKCEETWAGSFGDDWLEVVNQRLHHPQEQPSTVDIQFLFNGLKATWNEAFGFSFGPDVRSLVFELAKVRNSWAHQDSFSSDDTLRALDSMERLLGEFGDTDSREAIKALRRDLMRQMFEEQSRSDRRKAVAKPTEGQPQGGLTPWRDVVTPHSDVAAGRFQQAEFAADLQEVIEGRADEEYGDPRAFFARTYLTTGLTDLLVGAARRLAGEGGDPVVQLQTNFGGGKTHSMIALYHLASGTPVTELPGVSEALTEAKVSLPANVNRAVLVGQKISPAAPQVLDDGTRLHTLWGRLAYQLGGREGYELLRRDDENATNPGDTLRELFERHGPAVVLIDEWVAYARQLREGGDGERLAGGDFDTQFTFAQNLTEAAAAVPNVVVLVSIPASDIEVGGERGRIALERLTNVVTRNAAQWQPASPDESFEIVRRRLFDPISESNVRLRDGVIGAFVQMYRDRADDFPTGCSEADYRRRMELSYPIHPELFDRLFGDWSALDEFQRTRGVLRLMALVISRLWQQGDQSLLIMPGTLPMDFGPLVSEMRRYLADGWDAVIKSDVDGENALPWRIDNDNKHFGRISATRRAARTVYMGSAAKPDSARGLDIRRVVLGCAQPGEPVAQFGDALKRLSGQATHLYVDGTRYWYSLQQNVTRLAADRAELNYTDKDADDEVRRRIGRQRDRGDFAAVQVFADGPGDVPDDDEGVRLVVLPPAPAVTHSTGKEPLSAEEFASKILGQREAGPRVNRNLLAFVAADGKPLVDLRKAAREHLAWCSIVDDIEVLDLTAHQQRQAQTKMAETNSKVDSLIAEAFTLVLTPSQEPGTSEVIWHTTRARGQGDIGARVSRRLSSEERLIARYGGVRVRMDLDRYGLWSDRHDIAVGDLWNIYARYPYMPRLASFDVLAAAIGDGTANLNWAQETFGYADAHDGTTWVGVRTGQHVSPVPSGFIIHPDHVPVPEPPPPGPSGPANGGGGSTPTPPDPSEPSGPAVTRFYAQFDLDSLRGASEVGDILREVVAHLGEDVELTLEIQARSDDGYSEATQRTVSENASTLGAFASEFEQTSAPDADGDTDRLM